MIIINFAIDWYALGYFVKICSSSYLVRDLYILYINIHNKSFILSRVYLIFALLIYVNKY
jgi:hypothetical protein